MCVCAVIADRAGAPAAGALGEAVLGRKVGETLVRQVAGCVCARVRVSGGLLEGQGRLHVSVSRTSHPKQVTCGSRT